METGSESTCVYTVAPMTRMHPTLGCGCESRKRGLHLVVLYLVVGEWRVPWSFRVWRGKGYTSPAQLACKLLANVPPSLVQGRTVLVQADTEFGTADFIEAVRKRAWRPIVGMRGNRKLQDGRCLKDLHRHAKPGVQVYLKGIDHPLTVSWFWLKRAEGKRELRFVVSSYPYSGAYLVRLGRKRWATIGLLQNSKTPVWLALLWSNHSVGGLSLADSLADCLFARSLDGLMALSTVFGLESCQSLSPGDTLSLDCLVPVTQTNQNQ